MKIRFIADLHLSHQNMALRRGFSSVEEHDAHIIEKWNSVVYKRDITYILGDITMEKKDPYHLLDKLAGIKHVVLGNHDRHQHVSELLKHVQSVSGMKNYKGFFLTHCPVHPTEITYRGIRGNIHGHVHANVLSDPGYYCVSCEVVDYTPVSLADLGIKELSNEVNTHVEA